MYSLHTLDSLREDPETTQSLKTPVHVNKEDFAPIVSRCLFRPNIPIKPYAFQLYLFQQFHVKKKLFQITIML